MSEQGLLPNLKWLSTGTQPYIQMVSLLATLCVGEKKYTLIWYMTRENVRKLEMTQLTTQAPLIQVFADD